MITKTTGWKKYKFIIMALAFPVWFLLIIHAIRTNPSAGESKEQLVMMKSDLSGMLSLGGEVVNRYENAKFGGALLSVEISDEGWSQLLLANYQTYLVGQGWQPNQSSSLTYCKHGALATFLPQAGMRNKIGINYISMVYDPVSKKTCEQMQTELKK